MVRGEAEQAPTPGRKLALNSESLTPGSAQPAPPSHQSCWISSAQGPGTQQIQVDLRHGSWAVVAMNADGHPAVAADRQAEVTLRWFHKATKALLGGLARQAIGTAFILIGTSGLARRHSGR